MVTVIGIIFLLVWIAAAAVATVREQNENEARAKRADDLVKKNLSE